MHVNDIIESLVKEHPFLADDDRMLLLAVWEKQGLVLTDDQKTAFLSDCSAAESITRQRRELLSRGIISQSPEAKAKRKQAMEKYRNRYARQPRII